MDLPAIRQPFICAHNQFGSSLYRHIVDGGINVNYKMAGDHKNVDELSHKCHINRTADEY